MEWYVPSARRSKQYYKPSTEYLLLPSLPDLEKNGGQGRQSLGNTSVARWTDLEQIFRAQNILLVPKHFSCTKRISQFFSISLIKVNDQLKN